MSLRRAGWHFFQWLLAWYALALLAIAPFAGLWRALAVASLAVVIYQSLQLGRLLRIIDDPQRQPRWGTRTSGIWSILEARLARRRRQLRQCRDRLFPLLRAFRQAAAVLPDAVVILNRRNYTLQWFNEAATRLLGLSYPRDIGARFTDLVRSPRVVSWFESAGGEPLYDLASPNDPALSLSLHLIPYTADQSLLVGRDITKLAHLEKVRRDFVANVSHELRTPLTVVHGYLDLIDTEDYPALANVLEEMRRQSRRMKQIVEDLLTLSRLEAHERLPEEVIDMANLLETLRREAVALSQGKHEISVLNQAGCHLRGSLDELHSAFSNLVSNAVRYTPPGGKIMIRYKRTVEGGVTLAVWDTGCGIPPQHVPRITERFYRVSNSRSRETGGTGLGLSIVKHVLNLHQARLEIESEIGRGSVFRCRFGVERVVVRHS